MFVAGGRPNKTKELYMVKDAMGITVVSKDFITSTPELYEYIGFSRVNSTIYHTYEFIPDRGFM